VAAAAVVLGCALAAYPVVRAGDVRPIAVALAIVGVLAAILALVARTSFVGAALCALAVEYLLTEATGSVSTVSIVAYAAGLVVLCELLFWGSGLRAGSRADGSVVAAWVGRVVLIGAGSALLAVAVFAVTRFRMEASFVAAIVGSVAVVVLFALPWLLARTKKAL
jgi:hypothetical protein